VADETPVSLSPGPKIVLHLLPITALSVSEHHDVTRVQHRREYLSPLPGGGFSFRYNLDGELAYIPALESPGSHGYVQLFRNGTIESVDSYMLGTFAQNKLIPQPQLEQTIISRLESYLSLQQELDLEPPIFLMLSLIGVKGYHIRFGMFQDTRPPIDRDAVLLPAILMEDMFAEPAGILRPVFDGVWQAAGWPLCRNYDEQGRWEDRSSKFHS
jgi:hypothetical protein